MFAAAFEINFNFKLSCKQQKSENYLLTLLLQRFEVAKSESNKINRDKT